MPAYVPVVSTGCSLLFHSALLLLLCSFSPPAPNPEPVTLLVTLSPSPQLSIASEPAAVPLVPEPQAVLSQTLPPLPEPVEPPLAGREEPADEDSAPVALEDLFAGGMGGLDQAPAPPGKDALHPDSASIVTTIEDWAARPGRQRGAAADGGGSDGGLIGGGGVAGAGQGGGSGGGDGTGQGTGRGSGQGHGGSGSGTGSGMPGIAQATPPGTGNGGRRAAQVVDRKPGEYPDAARRAGLEGAVLLLVEVLHNGKVGQVAVQESSGVAELDEAARRAVRRWRFEPAKESDQAVTSWAAVKYRYTLADR